MKKIILFMLVICIISTPLIAQDYWYKQIISVSKSQEYMKKLLKMDLDFLLEKNDRVYIIASPKDFLKLREENVPYILETQNFSMYDQNRISIQGGINGDFHSYAELERELFSLENSYPQLAKVFDIGDSLEKRNIYALKISDNVYQDEKESEVIFIGCHHAREWISVEIPLLFGKHLLENYTTDSEIKDIVNQSEIWIVPLLNPDGLEYSIYFYRYWRKNRRDNGDGTYGIDLNRNYGYKWGYDNEGSSPNTDSETFRGEGSFSEPETQAIRDLFAQRNFQAMISYHSYTQIIIYPWGYKHDPAEDDELLEEIAANMSHLMQSVNGNVYNYGQAGGFLYLTNGGTTDWSYGTHGIPSYTIELPPDSQLRGQFFNAEEDIQPIFNENLPAMLYLIDWSVKNFNSANNYQFRIDPRPMEMFKSDSKTKRRPSDKISTKRLTPQEKNLKENNIRIQTTHKLQPKAKKKNKILNMKKEKHKRQSLNSRDR